MDHDTMRRATAEFFGTFWLTFGGCGAAILSAAFPDLGIGFLGVALALGLTVLTMAYAVGHISGGHFNPAVTLGLRSAQRTCSAQSGVPLSRNARHRAATGFASMTNRVPQRMCVASVSTARSTGMRAVMVTVSTGRPYSATGKVPRFTV